MCVVRVSVLYLFLPCQANATSMEKSLWCKKNSRDEMRNLGLGLYGTEFLGGEFSCTLSVTKYIFLTHLATMPTQDVVFFFFRFDKSEEAHKTILVDEILKI